MEVCLSEIGVEGGDLRARGRFGTAKKGAFGHVVGMGGRARRGRGVREVLRDGALERAERVG